MKIRSVLLTIALASASTFALAAADVNTFTIVKGGKTVGKASYTIDFSKDVYHVKGRFEYRFTPTFVAGNSNSLPDGTAPMLSEAQVSEDYKVDANGNYLSGYTQNTANQMLTSFQPSKARDSVVVGSMQGGIAGLGKTLPMPKPDFLVVADYDPSGVQIFITTALAHPHSDNKYTLLTAGGGARPSNSIVYTALQIGSAASGTLDGAPVTLKHYEIHYAKGQSDVYIDEKGNLMQADMGPLDTSYIRAKFVLSPK
jgi:hypothetical protein